MSGNSDDSPVKDLLLADLEHFGESMWRNEEVGEKRFSFLVTLATAIAAGLVAYKTSDPPPPPIYFQRVSGAAMAILLIVGMVSYVRMLKRNLVTDEYKATLSYIRQMYSLLYPGLPSDYRVPYRPPNRSKGWVSRLSGGYLETVCLFNGLFIGALLALGFKRSLQEAIPVGAALAALLWIYSAKAAPRTSNAPKAELGVPPSFRAGVGAVVVDHTGSILHFQRSDKTRGWQLPQGGMRKKESARDAVYRELQEETGLTADAIELTAEYPEPLAYRLPTEYQSAKTGLGQVHYWFYFRLRAGFEPALPTKEFRECKRSTFDQVVDEAVEFRRPVYKRLREHFKTLQ